MPTIKQVREELQSTFRVYWAADTEIFFDNVGGDPDGLEYTYMSMTLSTGTQASVGAPGFNNFRKEGLILISVNVERGVNMDRADDLSQKAYDYLTSFVSTLGVRIQDARVVNSSRSGSSSVDGAIVGSNQNYLQINVIGNLIYDEVK